MYTRFMADNGVCERRREFVEGLYIYAKEFYEDASVKIRGARKTGIESVSKESQSGGGAFESLI